MTTNTTLTPAFAVAMLTAVQAAIVNNARANSTDAERKQIKKEVFAVVKAKFGIPESTRIKANTKGVGQKGYLILHDKQGNAFGLGTDGKFNGQMYSRDQLFPAPVAVAADTQPASQGSDTSGSIFGGAVAAKWFRLDPAQVAAALTTDDLDSLIDGACPSGMVNVTDPGVQQGGDLPTPHLMLAGRTDLAITADGSIYRKQ
jgi:hypothetical protein